MSEMVLGWISHVSDIIGIVGAIFAIMIWFILRMQDKRLKGIIKTIPKIENFQDMVKYHSEIQTISPYAFCLSLLPDSRSKSIKVEVMEFLRDKALQTKDKRWEMPIEELSFDGLGQHNIEEFINELSKKRQWFVAKNATEIHLFIAGPVMSATLIGAIFDNWRPVKLYHKNPTTGKYEFWCPLIK
ncbi:MAG: SAVED domain-containing protein [Candidatus Desantisbacteria bacterium]